jgi:hypothetical protein
MLMLIDAREPPGRAPGPGPPDPIEPNWRLWGWIAGSVALLVLAQQELSDPVAVVLVFGAFFAACKAFDTVVGGDGRGLRDWRQ